MSNKKTFTLEALHGYVAPSVSVLACQNEGILCASGDYTLGGGGSYTDADINDNGSYN